MNQFSDLYNPYGCSEKDISYIYSITALWSIYLPHYSISKTSHWICQSQTNINWGPPHPAFLAKPKLSCWYNDNYKNWTLEQDIAALSRWHYMEQYICKWSCHKNGIISPIMWRIVLCNLPLKRLKYEPPSKVGFPTYVFTDIKRNVNIFNPK